MEPEREDLARVEPAFARVEPDVGRVVLVP
ncbi:MAG: hypothetical protein QOE69_2771, partial [Thermoleophilaceae bacterium]|nr:hypothetical protein [Thermoleophilaceae bacterium]